MQTPSSTSLQVNLSTSPRSEFAKLDRALWCTDRNDDILIVVIFENKPNNLNFPNYRILKQLETVMPGRNVSLLLLVTAQSFSTSVRIWCERHSNFCKLVLSNSNVLTDVFEATQREIDCRSHFVLLSNWVRLDTSFISRVKACPQNVVSCLLPTSSASCPGLAFKLPHFVLSWNAYSANELQTTAAAHKLLGPAFAAARI